MENKTLEIILIEKLLTDGVLDRDAFMLEYQSCFKSNEGGFDWRKFSALLIVLANTRNKKR